MTTKDAEMENLGREDARKADETAYENSLTRISFAALRGSEQEIISACAYAVGRLEGVNPSLAHEIKIRVCVARDKAQSVIREEVS